MKKYSVISLLLVLSLLVSLVIPVTLALPAQAAEGQEDPKPDNGMVINKTASDNGDGTYTITLEAYATGAKLVTEVTKDIPADIVLVLDQSGSMAYNMDTYAFRQYTNRNNDYFYSVRHNGGNKNLYYALDDGSYASVSVELTEGEKTIYTKINSGRNNSTRSGATNYWSNRENLYALVDGQYQKVTLTQEREGSWWNSTIYYVYKLPDETEIARSSGDQTVPAFTGTDDNALYLLSVDTSKNVYTYTYTDKDSQVHTIGTSTGADTQPTDFTLYERYSSGTESRLSALKTAVRTFANSVAAKAAGPDGELGTADDVNHRVAVVGFASESGYGNNTELLSISGSNSGTVGIRYGSFSKQNLKDVLQDMDTQAGQTMVKNAIDALAAEGATRADLGMDMANQIMAENPVPENEERARVVVFFTDGVPTSSSSFDNNVANSAVSYADSIKNGGAKVYSVGVFEGADATSAGSANGTETQKANRFMQRVSSNNGTPRNPSYYLSAADAGTLNSIFQQISDQIEEGGSSTTLGEQTVIRDIIAPQFALPEGAGASDITLETYSYVGENRWNKNADAMGASAAVSGDQVSVTGFDFSENWCGTETQNGNTAYRGNKLVIKFNVTTKEGFLGGNGVYTNTSAGVYENSGAEDPVMEYNRPQVDVAIQAVTVTAPDRSVYLLQGVTADELRNGAAVNVGGVAIDLSKPDANWGLEPWQNEYVDITVEIRDQDGNVITTDLTGLTEDKEYTVSVTVVPKTEGKAAGQTGTDKGGIYVFKPELTYKDSSVYYGDAAPTDYGSNLTNTAWKHDDPDAPAPAGEAPALAITYTPDGTKIAGGRISTKEDIPVSAVVKTGDIDITLYTTFVHTPCDPACGWTAPETGGDPAYLLHVATCELTVQKVGGEPGETYVMDVYKDGALYTQVTVGANSSVTIRELPVGTYSVSENASWAWRYTSSVSGPVTLAAGNHADTVTCTNKKDTDQWLNDYSAAAENTFGTVKN